MNMIKKIEDKRILDVLKKKNEFVVKNQVILDKMAKLEKEMNKLNEDFNSNLSKTKVFDDKARPMILEVVSKTVLGEYDELARVFLDGEGTKSTNDWKMEFVDRLDEFKKLFKDRAIKSSGNMNNTKK